MKAIQTLITAVFIITSTSLSALNLSDFNPELPKGLIYQVKIGPLNQPIASSIKPLFEHWQEEVTAEGLYVYFAGQFKGYRKASIYESTLRHYGLKSASTIAFFSGRPIPVEDGLTIENDQNAVDKAYVNSEREAIPVDDLNALLELQEEDHTFYYTVQVGVFYELDNANPVNELSELNIRENAKGQFVCSSGRTNNLESAQKLCEQLRSNGYTDAFITAYVKGERISTQEAIALESELGKLTLVSR